MTLREIDDEGNVRHNLESRLHLHHQCEKQNDKRILHEEKKAVCHLRQPRKSDVVP